MITQEQEWVRRALDFLGSDAIQLRAPFFMSAIIGAMGWSIAWLVNSFQLVYFLNIA